MAMRSEGGGALPDLTPGGPGFMLYEPNANYARNWIAETVPNVHPVGRNGMHKYNNQDHSMYTAMLAVAPRLALPLLAVLLLAACESKSGGSAAAPSRAGSMATLSG